MSRRLALQGASADDAVRMREMLRHASGVLSTTWTLHDGDDVDLLVIDIDSVYGHMDWLRAQTGGRAVAALTQNPNFEDAEFILRKPIDQSGIASLLNAVHSIAPLLTYEEPKPAPPPVAAPAAPVPRAVAPAAPAPRAPAPAAPAPRAAAPTPAVVIEVTPPPAIDRKLADWLADGALAQAMRLRMAGASDLTLDPGNKTYYADGTSRALAPYSQRVIALKDWEPVDYAELNALQTAGKGQPYSRLLWLHHALGSNGRLSSELDPEAKYKLNRWPQIEREFPKHFRIATVMMKQPATLAEVAEQSGASLPDVIDFTNAYNATGYVDMEPVVSAPSGRDTGRGAILSRLRNPFGAS
jgi:hypothetical protein